MADELTVETPEGTPAGTPEATAAPASDAAAATVDDQSTAAGVADAAQPTPQTPTYLGGRFKSAEQLEAYALGLEKARTQPTTPQTPQTQQVTPPTLDQLKYSKAHWRDAAFKAQAAGDAEAYQKAVSNLDWCDDQLVEARLSSESKRWQGQSAAETLIQEGQELLKPYQANLVPGDPLYETAQRYFAQAKQAIDAGASIDQILGGLTVLAAAQKTGKTTAGVKQQAAQEFSKAMQQAGKQAIITGAGAATKTGSGKITAEQIANMDAKEFAAYEKSVMEQSQSVGWRRDQRF